MICWGIATNAGMQAQVRALGEAIGAEVEMKDFRVMRPFVWLPNGVFAAGLRRVVVPYLLTRDSERVAGKRPQLVISCGRRSAITAMGLRSRKSFAKTRFIHIQDPYVNPKNFDMVVAMEHDHIAGDNVLHTHFALHSITPEKLEVAAAHFAPFFEAYPKPYVAVLLGGSTNKYKLLPERMREVIANLRAMLVSMSGSLLITVSPRTGKENIDKLKEAFNHEPRVYIYDGTGDNPYMGMLGLASSIVVSNDSVNMMTEAAATGKPLYLLQLPKHDHTKPAMFAEKIKQIGIARLWSASWEHWDYDAGKEMRDLGQTVKQYLLL